MNLKFFKVIIKKTKNGYEVVPRCWTRKVVRETDKNFYFSDGGYVRKIENGKIGHRISQNRIFSTVREVYTIDKSAKDCYHYMLDMYYKDIDYMKNSFHRDSYAEYGHDIDCLKNTINKFLSKYH